MGQNKVRVPGYWMVKRYHPRLCGSSPLSAGLGAGVVVLSSSLEVVEPAVVMVDGFCLSAVVPFHSSLATFAKRSARWYCKDKRMG